MSTSASSPDVGRRIRELRRRRRLSQRQLAEPRYDGSFVSQIESGRRSPSPDALAYFASRLAVSVEELSAPVPPSMRVELELALAEARSAFDAGQPDAAREAFVRLQALAGGNSPEFEAEAFLGIGELDERAGRVTDAISRYQSARASAQTDELGLRIGLALGRAYRTGGDLAYSIDVLSGVLERAIDAGWLVEAVRAAAFLGATLSERGDHQRAGEVLESVAEQARTLADPRAL